MNLDQVNRLISSGSVFLDETPITQSENNLDYRTPEQHIQEGYECSLNKSIVKEFLILPENHDEWWLRFINESKDILFSGEPIQKPHGTDMYDLLVEIGAFKSKGDAKKNWIKSGKEIPPGHSMWIVGKKKTPLIIYKACYKFTVGDWN